MLFDEINKYAIEVMKGKDCYDELLKTCLPYLYYLLKKYKFHDIPHEEVKDLARAAISHATADHIQKKLPFSFVVGNSFRKACRERFRAQREHYSGDILIKCYGKEPKIGIGIRKKFPAPEIAAENNESLELVKTILKNHDHFSKQVVYQKTRGSTYPDMADIFSSTINECKRVYWHDMNHLRQKMNPTTAGKSEG